MPEMVMICIEEAGSESLFAACHAILLIDRSLETALAEGC
jgi:hypothetical protein